MHVSRGHTTRSLLITFDRSCNAANSAVLQAGTSLVYGSAWLQGACVSGSKTMLVMEFVEGGDLWRNLQRPGTRVGNWRLHGRKVALDIARGLCFLHAHSIV